MSLSGPRDVVYLHGFASSALSSKAQYFRERFTDVGVSLHTPDFNEPDFASLTVTRMIAQTTDLLASLPEGPVALMGSSLGAFVAWHAVSHLRAAQPRRPVSHLVLLAPAVTFARDRIQDFGEGVVDAWQQAGEREIFHYGYNEPRRLRYAFYEDAMAHAAATPTPAVPALVFQGRHDEIVSPVGVQTFFDDHPDVTLHMMEDGHQLLQHLDAMWEHTRRFLDV